MLSLLKIKINKLKFGCLPSECLLSEKIKKKKCLRKLRVEGGGEIEGKWAEVKGI